MNPEQLRAYTLHPKTWESWVPREILENYIYDSPSPVAVGYAQGPGWFVLTKDPHERVLYSECETEPIAFNNPAHIQWGKVGRPKELPRIEGACMSLDALSLILKFPPSAMTVVREMKVGTTSTMQVQDRLFALLRIHVDLYRVMSISRVHPAPQPRPA